MNKKGSCWEGYVQKGMKKKGNRMVPNCVPAMKSGGLTKWFNEKWVDIGAKKKGGKYQECGRKSAGLQKGNTRSAYHLQKPQRCQSRKRPLLLPEKDQQVMQDQNQIT